MRTFRSILCPVDFSDTSREALRWAVALATRHQSRLIVITAVDPLLAQALRTQFKQDPKGETETFLRKIVVAALSKKDSRELRYEIDVEVGNPPDVILDAASRYSADLIVIGTHGYRGFRKFVLGSTTQRVLRHALIPILAVPHATARSGESTDTQPIPITTVLAPTDFSEASDNAVRWAADLAHEYAARLVLAHAVPPLIIPVEWSGYVEGLDDERLNAARKRLKGQSTGSGGDLQIERLVMLGWPAESIAEIVEAHKVNLVVMGLTGTERPLAPRPGSTAYEVLSSAHVPVLVVPPTATT